MSETTDDTSTLIQKAHSIITEHSQRSQVLTRLREALDKNLSVWVLTFAQAVTEASDPSTSSLNRAAPYLGALVVGPLTDKTLRTLFPTQDAALASLNTPDSASDQDLTADGFAQLIAESARNVTVTAIISGLMLAADLPAKYWVVGGSLLGSTAYTEFRVNGQKLSADAVRSMLQSAEVDR